MTPEERRKKICELAADDEDFRRAKAEYDRAKYLFDQFTLTLPPAQQDLLRSYPGMGYFLHHKMLNLICENMKFEDE